MTQTTDCSNAPLWIVSVRKTGHFNQCVALADALGLTPKKTIEIDGKAAADTPRRKRQLRFLTPLQTLWAGLSNRLPKRLIIISSGRSVLTLCRFWRRIMGDRLFIIHVAVPRPSTDFVDILIASRHQLLPDAPAPDARKVLHIDGVLARSQAPVQSHSPREPHVVLLVGGKNVTFDYDGPTFRASLKALNVAFPAAKLSVVFSRRTFPRTQKLLRQTLGGPKVRFIEVNDRDGYKDALATASRFVVCPDSITMVSECCARGLPVHVLDMDRAPNTTENARFIDQFLAAGYLSVLEETEDQQTTRQLEDQANLVAEPIKEALSDWLKD